MPQRAERLLNIRLRDPSLSIALGPRSDTRNIPWQRLVRDRRPQRQIPALSRRDFVRSVGAAELASSIPLIGTRKLLAAHPYPSPRSRKDQESSQAWAARKHPCMLESLRVRETHFSGPDRPPCNERIPCGMTRSDS